jgi:hypothetical protein
MSMRSWRDAPGISVFSSSSIGITGRKTGGGRGRRLRRVIRRCARRCGRFGRVAPIRPIRCICLVCWMTWRKGGSIRRRRPGRGRRH